MGSGFEKKWAKVEAAARVKARKLNQITRKMARDASKKIHADRKKFAVYTAQSLAKMRASNIATYKAQKATANFQKKMGVIQKNMSKQNAKAKARSAQRLATYKKQIAHINKAIKGQQAKRKAIVNAMKKAQGKLK